MKIFISHAMSLDDPLVAELKGSLIEEGHEVFEPGSGGDWRLPVGHLRAEMSAAIRRSDAVIALLTSPSQGVYFELGLATGAHVPLLVVASRTEEMPADVLSVPYVQIVGDLARDVAAIKRGLAEIAEATDRGLEATYATAEAALTEAARDPEVLERLSPRDFEDLVVGLFSERGFTVTRSAGNRDRGVDLVLGADETTLVEVKRYSRQNLVSVGVVQELLGTLSATGAERAILVFSSSFTHAARALASEAPVELLTLEELLAVEAKPVGASVTAADLAVLVGRFPDGEPHADILIPAGSPLPVTVSRKYATASDDQQALAVEFAQRLGGGTGSHLADFLAIARLEIRLPPGVARGTEVEITATADVVGILRVAANILGIEKHFNVDLAGLVPGSSIRVALRDDPAYTVNRDPG